MFAQYNTPWDDPFEQLKKRIKQRMKNDKVGQQIRNTVQDSFQAALRAENIILSRTERDRLQRALLQDILKDLLASS